jgi:hypothetical protein
MIYGVGKECEPGASLIEVRMREKEESKRLYEEAR